MSLLVAKRRPGGRAAGAILARGGTRKTEVQWRGCVGRPFPFRGGMGWGFCRWHGAGEWIPPVGLVCMWPLARPYRVTLSRSGRGKGRALPQHSSPRRGEGPAGG